jgi:hypothetical protein
VSLSGRVEFKEVVQAGSVRVRWVVRWRFRLDGSRVLGVSVSVVGWLGDVSRAQGGAGA